MSRNRNSILCNNMRGKLFSGRRGLLDVSATSSRNESPEIEDEDGNSMVYLEVQYLHRSVKDFIETPHV